ncbi:MAG TPA: addiction module antidote protein [Allosphingosinicella sp.]|jgi:probable addiction module antidote protein
MKISKFDPMEHLDATEDHVELLNDALATGNPKVIVNAIAEIARGRGMSELARATGIGRSSLYKALADDANPTMETVMKVLAGLKLELTAASKKAAA